MTDNNINLYYYSGTGNTLLIVKEMVKTFHENGIHVSLHKIEYTDPTKMDIKSTVGLAFPVAFQSTYPFIWKFLRAMPKTNGTQVFMVDTMMMFSGAIVGPLKKVLTDKGYNCIAACEIKMPNNWFPKKIDAKANKNKINCGTKKAREYTESIIKGTASWNRIPFLSKGFYNICCNEFMMQNVNLSSGRKISLDKDKCIKCGLCVELCPVANISMEEYPKWHDLCEVCMRCINYCPSKAVTVPGKTLNQYHAVKANEILNSPSKN